MRTILHCDMNNFYASVECLYRTDLREKPVAVGGDVEQRHGIILAKNYPAKALGVKTGEAIWQAKQKCPGLVVLPPNYKRYLRFARQARGIFADYTDQIEPFGLDEAWLDVTASVDLFGSGENIADEIRKRIREELGITASVGVSWNKIFAKLGSDLRKPDVTTAITRENYRERVWPLPVGDLLYVGPATKKKLALKCIHTIGELAETDREALRRWFGKWGDVLYVFSNGLDASPVARMGAEAMIKSVGNSTTTPRDLENNEDVSIILYVLCESVAMRLRELNLECRTVEIGVRDNTLYSFVRQKKQPRPTNLARDLHRAAMELFVNNYEWQKPIRSIGVRGCELCAAGESVQLSLLDDEARRDKVIRMEAAMDDIRRRFGNLSICRAMLLGDRRLGGINPKDDHVIHPVGYF
ncbi:DNA polymerase IV [bioreactor metagenome]|uniref:DNA polymerase IV n=1 Tax=bioreactor metagenome TaxID=1076179 RepID=A0A644X7E7_9ZZZZ